MVPPSKLAIATSAVQRLIKEEASYHKEIEQQNIRIQKLENGGDGENSEYELKQERQALTETEVVLASLKSKIQTAVEQLEEQLANEDVGDAASAESVAKANNTLVEARKVATQFS